ncbi:hypothetical protein [Geomicrobium sp. JCM 19055]|uniref:hypothetical protein n=1 Tax=Geomicrobium sp. JCM 19055 TaxID=1460649 RepID=UPI0022366E33|nr:hypothetical protein [Geomicrobium sp. JCM 19055]
MHELSASHDDLRLTNKGSSTAIAYSNGVEPTCFAGRRRRLRHDSRFYTAY